MSAIATTYNVVSEFDFEVGPALAKSKLLEEQLNKVSGAADQVSLNLTSAMTGLLGQIGLYGGLAGAIYSAVKAADKYQQTQRSIANIFISNKMFDGATQFEDSMVASAGAMDNMKKIAREFSLPVSDFMSTAKMIGAGLINHGLDDSSMKNTTMLTRGYLKSAPMLGIDPGMAQGELMDMVNGRAHMSARLAQRLVNETAAMKPYGGGGGGGIGSRVNSGLTKFNNLTPELRLKTLTEALMQFGSNAKIVEANARSLSSQLQRMGDNITGMFSILKPIGDAILEPVKNLLLKINLWLESEGEKTSKIIGAMLRDIFSDLTGFYSRVQQLRSLTKDVHEAGHILEVETGILFVTWALRKLGFELKGGLFSAALSYLWTGLKTVAGWFVEVGGLVWVWRGLLYVLEEAVWPLLIFTTVLQGISKGLAMAKIENAKWIIANPSNVGGLFASLRDAFLAIISPIALAIDGIAEMTSMLLSHNIMWDLALKGLTAFAGVLQFIGDVVVSMMGVISAVMAGIMSLINALISLDWTKLKELPQDMIDGWKLMWNRFHKDPMAEIDNSKVAQSTVNINSVNINNQFKEQMEPDRIAFSLKEQLLKAATNKTRGSGGTLAGRAAVG